MKLNAIIVAGIVFQAGLVGSAQELESLKYGRTVQPKRFAWTDADGRMISPWIQVDPNGGSLTGIEPLLYDNFERDNEDPFEPTDDCYGHDCALPHPSNRWFFGTSTLVNQRQYVVDDMVVAPGAEGVPASRLELAYYLGPCALGESQVYIGITMYDDVSTDCAGFDCDGDGTPDCSAMNPIGPGLVIDFGVLECNPANVGYYIAEWATGPADPLPMPPDGQGGFSITIARDYDETSGRFTLAEAAQMMLWGNTDPKIDNPSDQEVQYWVDRDANQTHAIPDECFSAFFPNNCPYALGAMIAFYGAPGQPGFEPCTGEFVPGDCDQPCDMDCDGAVNALDIEPFLDLLFGPKPKPCNTCTGDTNGDGMINALDIEPFLECLFP